MQVFMPFIKVNAPNSNSPQRMDKMDNSRVLPSPALLRDMQQRTIGDYLIFSDNMSERSIDGYSVILLNNSIVYEGMLERTRKNGYGVQYNPNGSIVYEGYFRDDKYQGWGKTSTYTGQFREGLYDGYGVYADDTVYYQGFFKRAQPSGQGICFKGEQMVRFHPVKNIYEFLNLGLKNNMSILEQYKIDEIYLGEWKEGAKHGFGRVWKKNYWYSGQFSNDVPHGIGAEEVQTSKQGKVAQTIYKLGVRK